MADDKSNKGSQDSSRININEDYEIRYWTNALNCTKEELASAVEKAGTSATAVREHLKK